MRAALSCVVGLCGCGSLLGVHDFGDAMLDAVALDGAGDAPGACMAHWLDGTVTFSTPVPLATINAGGGAVDRDPAFSLDGGTLFWSTNRNTKSYDVWSATIAADGTAADAKAVASYNTDSLDETKVTFAAGGLDTILAAGKTNVGMVSQLGESLRQASMDAESFARAPFMAIDNGVDNVFDAAFAGGGNALYYSLAPAGHGSQILRATRAVGDAAWSAGGALFDPHVDTTLDADPAPSDDERLLVLSSNRTGVVGTSGLFYATRASPTEGFGDLHHLDALDGPKRDGDPALSPDACTLIFASDRDTNDLVFQLYITHVTP